MKTFLLSWGLIILAALFDSYASLIVKSRFNQLGQINFNSFKSILNYIFEFLKNPILLTAIIAFVSAPVLWFFALNKINLSVGYPVLVGFHLIFIFFFSIFILGESMSLQKLLGILLVFVSFYLFFK